MPKPAHLLAALGASAAVAACGSAADPKPAASPTPSPGASAAATAAATPGASHRRDSDGDGIPDAITVKGRLGDTFALQGSGLHDNLSDHTKTKVRVTLEGMRGPFKGFDIPAGQELIGVELRF
jgi:hypothetical protein